MFLWRCWMHFWQPCRVIFLKWLKVFFSMSENDTRPNIFPRTIFFVLVTFLTGRIQFWQPCRKVFFRRLKYFRSLSVNNKKGIYSFFSTKVFSIETIHALDTKNAIVTTVLKSFAKKTETILLNNWESDERFFSKDFLFPKLFLWTRRMQLRQTCQKDSRKRFLLKK